MRADLLSRLGKAVRARRDALSMTRRALAEKAGVSERFLAQVEGGEGNISVARLAMVADALETTGAALWPRPRSTRARPASGWCLSWTCAARANPRWASGSPKRLGIPLRGLDARAGIEAAAGMKLATLFELHGTASYRRLEREALRKVLAEFPTAVIATGGHGQDERPSRAAKSRTTTVWLRAREDHWSRVVAQGDARPMRDRANAMGSSTRSCGRGRRSARKARVVVDTSTSGCGARSTRWCARSGPVNARGVVAGIGAREEASRVMRPICIQPSNTLRASPSTSHINPKARYCGWKFPTP
ncbi:MAG: shikimate kinase [Polyangiales bacterium]